jgi:hypothetical protein
VPFPFLLGLVEAIRMAESSSHGQPTTLDLARVSSDLPNTGQLQFVAPDTGPLLVAEDPVTVRDVSVVKSQTVSIQVNPGSIPGNFELALALVVIPSMSELTPAAAQSTGSFPGFGGSLHPSASFLLEGLTGLSNPMSTTRLEPVFGAGSGTSLGFADTSGLSPNRSLNTTSPAVLLYGGEGMLNLARIEEGETQARGFFILPDEALRLPRLPLDPKEDDVDTNGEKEERMLPDPGSDVPQPFAEAPSGLVGDGSSLLPLTSLKKYVPTAEPTLDFNSGERLTLRPAGPQEVTQAATRLGMAAIDEAMTSLCFAPWEDVPADPTGMENALPEGLRDRMDCQSSEAAIRVHSHLTEGTRQAAVDVLFGLALSTHLWDPHRMSNRESRGRLQPTL